MKISFFAKVKNTDAFDRVNFYKQDIEALKKITPDVSLAMHWHEIDWTADVIFVWWWTYAFVPVLIGKILRKKVIITGTFNYRPQGGVKGFYDRSFIQRMLIKFSMKYATMNILVSRKEYDLISKDWNLPNITYSPHGIYTSVYKPAFIKRERFFFSISWLQKTNVYRKGVMETIQAVSILKKKYPDILFILSGKKGDALNDIENYIKCSNLENNIRVVGAITEKEKIDYLQKCMCYVQPSRYEGFGLAVAEAMSCGALVLTTSAGELENVVDKAGIIIDEVTPSVIANMMEIIYETPDIGTTMGAKASKRIMDKYPVESRYMSLMEIIENC